MKSIFFAPQGEPAPVKTGDKIQGRFIIGKFLGNFPTASYIGWEFEVVPIRKHFPSQTFQAVDPSQWAEVRQAG